MSGSAPFKQALAEAMSSDPKSAWEIINAQRSTIKGLRDEVERLRGYITSVVELLMDEEGEQVPICCEPDRADAPECVRQSDGLGFDLIAPFTDEFWCELIEIQVA